MSDTEPIGQTTEAIQIGGEGYRSEVQKMVVGLREKFPNAFVEKPDGKGGSVFLFPNAREDYNRIADRKSLDSWEGAVNSLGLLNESGLFVLVGSFKLRALNLTAVVDKCGEYGAKDGSDFRFGTKSIPVSPELGAGLQSISQFSFTEGAGQFKEKLALAEKVGIMIEEQKKVAEDAKQALGNKVDETVSEPPNVPETPIKTFSAEDALKNF